jgi:hypothetical protein
MGTSKFNKELKKYKDIHKGKTGILLSTGPTIENFIKLEGYENFIKFGVNKIYDYDLVKDLDYYLFGSDFYLNPTHNSKVKSLDKNLTKFSSVYRDGKETGLGNINREDSDILGCIPFECCLDKFPEEQSEDKLLGHSIVFPAMQIIFYMGISKIFIVGCDLQGHSNELPYWWKELKAWKDIKYPDVEIITVNPIGLKEVFQDYEQV